MVEWFHKIEGLRVVIIDNDSTYEPLLEWYKTGSCEVIFHKSNGGPYVAWTGYVDALVRESGQKFYAITDSDLDFSNVPLDLFDKIKELYESLHSVKVVKIGTSLETNDLPDNEYTQDVKQWESRFWNNPMASYDGKTLCVPIYQKPIDTTFAVYHYGRGNRRNSNFRMDRPYTVRHLPWYEDINSCSEEYKYYIKNANFYSIWGNKFRSQIEKRAENKQ